MRVSTDADRAIRRPREREPVLVHRSMVSAAQQGQVGQSGCPTTVE